MAPALISVKSPPGQGLLSDLLTSWGGLGADCPSLDYHFPGFHLLICGKVKGGLVRARRRMWEGVRGKGFLTVTQAGLGMPH